MSRENHRRHDEELERLRKLEITVHSKTPKYSRDFVYFVISLFLPLGYGETDLISRSSVWHVIVGWALWLIPVILASHILWMWLESKGQSTRLKVSLMVVIGTSFVLAARFSVREFIERKMEEQQADVRAHLKVEMFSPSTNIFKSGVTVTNGSATDIGEHVIRCKAKRIVLDEDVVMNDLNIATVLRYTAPLRANGDSETSYCLVGFDTPFSPVCGDVTVDIEYSLVVQPSIHTAKRLRFVGRYEGREFIWRGQNVDYPDTFCKLPNETKPRPEPSP